MTTAHHEKASSRMGTIHMRRPYQKSPELWGPGLNVSVGASLLGQFGNDDVNVERVEERRIERDQPNATPIRFSLRQTMWHGRFNFSVCTTSVNRTRINSGVTTSIAAPVSERFRMVQSIAPLPN